MLQLNLQSESKGIEYSEWKKSVIISNLQVQNSSLPTRVWPHLKGLAIMLLTDDSVQENRKRKKKKSIGKNGVREGV